MKHLLRYLLLLALFASLASFAAPSMVAAPLSATDTDWRSLGISSAIDSYGGVKQSVCFDATRPGVLLLNQPGSGTVAFDWLHGTRQTVTTQHLDLCGPNGYFYSAAGGQATRFSIDAPARKRLAHMPTHIAQDGTNIVYAFQSAEPFAGHEPGRLFYSPDGGDTWAERGQQFGGNIISLIAQQADARALYIFVADNPLLRRNEVPYKILFSPDAGLTWTESDSGVTGLNGAFQGLNNTLLTIPGSTTPVNAFIKTLNTDCPYDVCSYGSDIQLASFDGGNYYTSLFARGSIGEWDLNNSDKLIVHTDRGFLRTTIRSASRPGGSGNGAEQNQKLTYSASFAPPVYFTRHAIERSTDGNQWQELGLPEHLVGAVQGTVNTGELRVAPADPGSVFLSFDGYVYYSSDSGETWHEVDGGVVDTHAAGISTFGVTPYLPLSIIARGEDGQLYIHDLPEAGKRNAAPTAPVGAVGGKFYTQTGHNLYPMFQPYWTNNGGLAQFGYPISEPLREVSGDGKAYMAQYFQRNKFEYHPENPAPYDVLLGRLGSDAAAPLKQSGHGAFKHFDDMHYPHSIYFAQTGHNLRNSFLDYWQAHGGLAIYGYPISEEFEQRSATDGKTYIVQYFERNRFEYHPENKGTANEVLLGLLGSDALRQRGWIK